MFQDEARATGSSAPQPVTVATVLDSNCGWINVNEMLLPRGFRLRSEKPLADIRVQGMRTPCDTGMDAKRSSSWLLGFLCSFLPSNHLREQQILEISNRRR